MRKKKKNRTQDTRKSRIIDRIISFKRETIELDNEREYVLWINRIISFIKNEFPKKIRYKDIISRLNKFIKDDYELTCSRFTVRDNVPKILLDLAYSYDFDLQKVFYINFNPKIKEKCLELVRNKHYAQAVFESVKALNNYVKNKAKITDKDLSDAMAKAFNEKNPIIKLNDLKNQSDID